MGRRPHAERYGERPRQQQRGDGEQQGIARTRGEQWADGRVVGERKAEIAAQGGLQPATIPYRDWTIESVLRAHARDRFPRDLRIEAQLVKERAGREVGQQETKNGGEREQPERAHHAPQQVSHARAPWGSATSNARAATSRASIAGCCGALSSARAGP